MATPLSELLKVVEQEVVKPSIPDFRVGDTVKVHARIVEGNKERVQIFEGVVIRRSKHNRPTATFTVRKVSFNIGVERTFMVHSPRIEQIQLVARGQVRRAGLYYLRDLRGKAAKIKSQIVNQGKESNAGAVDSTGSEQSALSSEGASA